jgi:2-methylcitrate dehydratase
MTKLDDLDSYVVNADYVQLSNAARVQAQFRVLNALGCAIGAPDAEPIRMIVAQNDDFGGNPLCTLIGDGRTAPDRASSSSMYSP